MTTLVASVVRRWADNGMEGKSLNDEQRFLLVNDTEEIDCLVDHCKVAIRAGVDPQLVAELLALTRKLYESNAREGNQWQEVTGPLDELARELHQAGQRSAWTNREIGNTLRPALRLLREREQGTIRHPLHDIFQATRLVDRVIREVPADQLFSDSVAHELKGPSFRLLKRMAHNPELMVA